MGNEYLAHVETIQFSLSPLGAFLVINVIPFRTTLFYLLGNEEDEGGDGDKWGPVGARVKSY